MGKKRPIPDRFKPRRPLLPIADPEPRLVLKAYMPASLVRDLSMYAIERGCSVSDLLHTLLRKAVPSLKVVARTGKTPSFGPADDDTETRDSETRAAI